MSEYRRKLRALTYPWLTVLILLSVAVSHPTASGKEGEAALPPKVDYVTVEAVPNTTGDGDTLFACLFQCIDATVTVKLTQSDNVTFSSPLPLTVEANGRRRFELATIRPSDPRKAWQYRYHFDYRVGVRSDLKSSTWPYGLPYTGSRFEVTQGFGGRF